MCQFLADPQAHELKTRLTLQSLCKARISTQKRLLGGSYVSEDLGFGSLSLRCNQHCFLIELGISNKRDAPCTSPNHCPALCRNPRVLGTLQWAPAFAAINATGWLCITRLPEQGLQQMYEGPVGASSVSFPTPYDVKLSSTSTSLPSEPVSLM